MIMTALGKKFSRRISRISLDFSSLKWPRTWIGKRKDVINLFRFIDWLMDLPKELAEFWRELSQLEEEKKMPYVTSVEKIGFEKGEKIGLRKGLIEAIELGLSIKFGDKGLRFLPTIQELKDIGRLEMIIETIKASDNLSEIESALA